MFVLCLHGICEYLFKFVRDVRTADETYDGCSYTCRVRLAGTDKGPT